MSALDLRGLLATLTEHEVEFVVIGAVAVAAHGYVRATADLDLVPEPSAANADRLARALASLNATLPKAEGRQFVAAGDVALLKRRQNVTLETDLGGLDIVQRVPGIPSFSALSEVAVSTELLGVPVKVTSLEHLRQMKQARGTTQDRADLEGLSGA